MSDQEFDGGGRGNRGGKAWGAGGGIAPATVSRRDLRTTSAGATAFSAAKVELVVETAFDLPVALNAGNTGSHGAEKSVEAPRTLSACACAIVKPSATMSAKPKAKARALANHGSILHRVRMLGIR